MRSQEMEEIRKSFVNQLFEEFLHVPSYSNFYSHAFNVIAKIGLQLKAKKEGLFTNYDWFNPFLREVLLTKVYEFLDSYIK
jgi:hypothetical protein